jgi:hypothetical protein
MGLDVGVEEQIPDIIFDEEDVSWINATTDLGRGSNLNVDEYVQPEMGRNYVPLSVNTDPLERALVMYPVEVEGGISQDLE